MLLFVIAITLHVGVGTGNPIMIFVVCVYFALEETTFLLNEPTNSSNWFKDAKKRNKYSQRSTKAIRNAFTAYHSSDRAPFSREWRRLDLAGGQGVDGVR